MTPLPKYLVARRSMQAATLVTFALAAHAGALQLLRGNLSSSMVLDTVPLSDPFAVLQMLAAGYAVADVAFIGAAIVLVFYAVIAGRAFCGWICPINVVTDAAAWIARRMRLEPMMPRAPRGARYVVLGLSVALSAVLGVAAFEWVSPPGFFVRGVVYGLSAGTWVVAGVFLFDLLIVKNGFCGHLCALGAFYALVGRRAALRVRFDSNKCTSCMACHRICPERQILRPMLDAPDRDRIIDAGQCLACGRCIDVCADDALGFALRPPGTGGGTLAISKELAP